MGFPIPYLQGCTKGTHKSRGKSLQGIMNTSEPRRLRAGQRLGHLFPRQRLSGLPGPGPLVGSEPKGTRGGEGDRAGPRDAWVIQMARVQRPRLSFHGCVCNRDGGRGAAWAKVSQGRATPQPAQAVLTAPKGRSWDPPRGEPCPGPRRGCRDLL